MTRLLMNAAVIHAGAFGAYSYEPLTPAELASWLGVGPWRSCLAFEATAAQVEAWTGIRPPVTEDQLPLEPGDEAAVVRLRARPPRGKRKPTEADFEIGILRRLS